jgi:broad specificity phosphatase PhoE
MNYYIFRHGETFETKHHLPYGDREKIAEILPEGIPAVKRLAAHLAAIETEANFSSPFKRCVQTADIVSEITNKKFIFDKRIGEFLNETFDDLRNRIKDITAEISQKGHKRVSICSHGYPISALINIITKGDFTEAELDNYPDPGILVIIQDKKVKYLDFNQPSSHQKSKHQK